MPNIFKKLLRCGTYLLVVSLLSTTAALAATAPAVTVLMPQVKSLGSPVAIALDPRGYYFVSDLRLGAISKFDLAGQLVKVLKVSAPAQGLAVDASGNLLVSQGNAVAVLDGNGVQLGLLGSGKGQFQQAAGIAVDVRGYIFVADSAANNIKIFTAARKLTKTLGSKGTGNGQFSLPTGIAYEKVSDRIVVADTRNSRVQFFSATGNYDFVKTIGSFGTAPLQFKSPVGVTFDYDTAGKLNRMFVADLAQNRVQVIDPTLGAFVSYIGANGLVNGQLMIPMDLAFDAVNRRLIVVNGNGHLINFGIDGGDNPGVTQGLIINPVPATVGTAAVTISGTAPANSNVVVTTSSTAAEQPVTFTSSSTWKASVSSLTPGSNVITAVAIDGSGTVVARQSVAILFLSP